MQNLLRSSNCRFGFAGSREGLGYGSHKFGLEFRKISAAGLLALLFVDLHERQP